MWGEGGCILELTIQSWHAHDVVWGGRDFPFPCWHTAASVQIQKKGGSLVHGCEYECECLSTANHSFTKVGPIVGACVTQFYPHTHALSHTQTT